MSKLVLLALKVQTVKNKKSGAIKRLTVSKFNFKRIFELFTFKAKAKKILNSLKKLVSKKLKQIYKAKLLRLRSVNVKNKNTRQTAKSLQKALFKEFTLLMNYLIRMEKKIEDSSEISEAKNLVKKAVKTVRKKLEELKFQFLVEEKPGGRLETVQRKDEGSRPLPQAPQSPPLPPPKKTVEVSATNAQPKVQQVATVQQVFNVVKVKASQSGGEARLRLHPPELGEVKVKVIVADGKVWTHFEVTNPQVKPLLESNMNQLRNSLQENGLQLMDFQVDVDSGGHGNYERFQNRPRRILLTSPDFPVRETAQVSLNIGTINYLV